MGTNDYEVLIKEYEKLNQEDPVMYPLSFDDYVAGLRDFFSKDAFVNAPMEKKVKVALLWMRVGRPLMKYYTAFKANDMELLNNALFETAHLMQISNISGTGTDHGYYGMNITPNLLAANRMERIPLVLPEENGLGKDSFSGTHIANLLMAILYDNQDFTEKALTLSEKEINKKIPEYLKNWIGCMRAILLKDSAQLNEQLETFCKSYMKCKEFGMNGFNRRFCVEAHGIYNLAIWAYQGALKKEIQVPQASNFCQELAAFQAEQNFGAGKIVYRYPEEMDLCNRLMHCEPPRIYLKNVGRKQVIDVDRFARDIAEKIG